MQEGLEKDRGWPETEVVGGEGKENFLPLPQRHSLLDGRVGLWVCVFLLSSSSSYVC